MKKILFYMLVLAGILSMASCQLGRHYTRPELNALQRRLWNWRSCSISTVSLATWMCSTPSVVTSMPK